MIATRDGVGRDGGAAPPPRPGMKIDQRDLTVTKVPTIPRTALAQPASYSSQPQQGRAGGSDGSEDGGGTPVLRRALSLSLLSRRGDGPPAQVLAGGGAAQAGVVPGVKARLAPPHAAATIMKKC